MSREDNNTGVQTPHSQAKQDKLSLEDALNGKAPHILAALYKFVLLEDFEELKPQILSKMIELEIKGSLLLAREGINGTVSGSRENLNLFLAYLRQDTRFSDLPYKESYAFEEPFHRAKVNLKKEIVTMGIPMVDPNNIVGTYVKPKEWNDLISDPNTILVDTRNDYEYNIGTFKGAVNPETATFREFPQWISDHDDLLKSRPKVAMFCTGGIRCEKATSYMRTLGYDEVYHLEGGILKYLEEVNETDSMWEGECFVFDERVSVSHGLEPGRYQLCHGCRAPISEEDINSQFYEPGVCCPNCYDVVTEDRKASFRERHKQILLAKKRNQKHIGNTMPYKTKRKQNKLPDAVLENSASSDKESQ